MWQEKWWRVRPRWELWLSELMWIDPAAASAFCALNVDAGEPLRETETAERHLRRGFRVA